MSINSSSDERTEPIHSEDDNDWELTYNVWHMLPWMERKSMASKYGYNSIGEFEEYLSLRRAVGETEKKPYPNDQLYAPSLQTEKGGVQPPSCLDDEDDHCSLEEEQEQGRETENPDDTLTDEELLRFGGEILKLPEEVLHSVFTWLSVDTFATLALVSPHWKHLTRTETVFHLLCKRIYLNQAKRRALHVSRFGGSYRNMLYSRPRVRTGLYVMKYAKVKRIQRDMWCEVPVGAILETVYYRYIYFQENGTLLYALSTTAPHEMVRRFLRVLRTGERDTVAVRGAFVVKKNSVTILAEQDWQHVKLELTIQLDSYWGRFGTLSFDRHLTSKSGNFDESAWPNDIKDYDVPNEMFRYLFDRRLN
mmetsp:Transcript_25595/g.38654  ORF Transcript_25595/g.38654 Transcript_25595/m.38654 type:complete len:364 (+) Transcript_25595:138-1229(+)